ncbi:hypothetical protein GUITHDRAFT_122927, partial [Guillardia theta CCMP2712]
MQEMETIFSPEDVLRPHAYVEVTSSTREEPREHPMPIDITQEAENQPNSRRESSIIEVNHASFLDAFVRNYTQQPGNFMDLALKDRHVYRHDPLLSVFSWEPITAFMSSRAGQLIALLVAVPWLVVRIYEVAALRQQDFFFPSISSMHVILEPHAIPSNVSCGWDARLELRSWFFPPLALLMAGIGAAFNRVRWVNKIFVFFGALDAACNMLIFLRLE